MKLPRCDKCHMPMRKVNNTGVYHCKACGLNMHFVECKHSRVRKYHTPWMQMKKCLICGEEFDRKLLKSIASCERRIKTDQAKVDRLQRAINDARVNG